MININKYHHSWSLYRTESDYEDPVSSQQLISNLGGEEGGGGGGDDFAMGGGDGDQEWGASDNSDSEDDSWLDNSACFTGKAKSVDKPLVDHQVGYYVTVM